MSWYFDETKFTPSLDSITTDSPNLEQPPHDPTPPIIMNQISTKFIKNYIVPSLAKAIPDQLKLIEKTENKGCDNQIALRIIDDSFLTN